MPLSIEQQHALLLKYDQPGKGYCPDGFDWKKEYERVAPLRAAIEREFQGECTEQNPMYIQDQCVFAELFVPAHLSTNAECRPCVVLCTFGDMVAISAEYLLVPGALEKLQAIFEQFRLYYISEEYAKSFYDGYYRGTQSWWQRYFDYL